ncbi:hypothetical protein DTO271D3_7451 [Paecilomyces variotii]|nr:hypothetical protein DTO271D3_7451 [Paecilomyces variotii]
MIPHTSAGVQPWAHQIRTLGSNNAGGPDGVNAADRAVSAAEKLPGAVSMPQNDQTVIDLTSGESAVQENERPTKRQKLDVATGPNVRSAEGKGVSSPAAWRSAPLAHRARPAWSFQELVSETYAGNPATGNDARNSSSPLPFPVRPWKYTPLRQGSNTGGSREASPERQVQTTPYHLETPSVAPVLKGEKVADFSPWTGNHPEDVLNEQAAKQGHYDRTQVSQNESNTARPSLYAQLRHRSGLQVLSSVFAAALEKRQTSSKLSAASTFKPPPRVTLTDNKREAWLRDLANPNVPLRRLSRTIPHGVRGKLLLDQCLSKSIPIGRAVWLAKCVGANEIRAFKRKGTSGTLALGLEVKWIRDWTMNVHLFIEGVISGCREPEWKAKIAYAVRLTARLYFEHLLDQDQHLDWFLSSLEMASLDRLPIWLMVLGVYWGSIVPFRRRGRKLMEILLEKLRHISQTGQEILLEPMSHRLSHLIRKLVYEQSSSAVIPRSWDKYRNILSSCLATNSGDEAVFQALADRNSYLQCCKGPGNVSQRSPLRQIITSLDSACSTYDINTASEACLSVIDDKEALIARVLEWCSTSFRQGLVRVYIAIRLLRKWRRSGVDTDHHIFSFLSNAKGKVGLHMDNVYHVVSELVRSQTFSVGRYLQWLIAKGIVDSHQENEHKEVCLYVELLRHIPVGRLPEHVCSLRNTLMLRAGFPPSEEGSIIDALRSLIRRLLPEIFGSDTRTNTDSTDNKMLFNQTHAVRSEIGQWIRSGVSRRSRTTTARGYHGHRSSHPDEVTFLTPDEFYTIRGIMEIFGDLSILADILNDAANSDNIIVLASVVDTLNYHFDSFTVIGAMMDLWRASVDAWSRVKSAGLSTRELVYSLVELGLRLPTEASTVAILRHELFRLDCRSTLAASSPVSDHMVDTISSEKWTSNEDLDQLLSSATGMEESLLATILGNLCRRLEFIGSADGHLPLDDTCRHLVQLRSFNSKLFDTLLIRWIGQVLKSTPRPRLSKVLVPLVGVGCVSLKGFFALARKMLQLESSAAIPDAVELRLELLELLCPLSPTQRDTLNLVAYRFAIAQQEFLTKNSDEILDLIRDTGDSFVAYANSDSMKGTLLSFHACSIPLLCHLLVRNPQSVVERCVQKLRGESRSTTNAVQKALNLLLGFNDKSDSALIEAEDALKAANDFSLPFCQMKLQLLFNAESGEGMKNGIIDVIFRAAVADIQARRSNWVDLVVTMSIEAVQQIRQRAERGFFSVALSDCSVGEPQVDEHSAQDIARVYLTIVEELAYSIPDTGVPSIAPLLTEKTSILLNKIVALQNSVRNLSRNEGALATDQIEPTLSTFGRHSAFWTTALLRMTIIHCSAFTGSSAAGKPSILDQTRLLIAICIIATSQPPSGPVSESQAAACLPGQQRGQSLRGLQAYAFDVAACLVDVLPEDIRQHCARFLKERCPSSLHVRNNPRLLYLLGPVADLGTFTQSQAAAGSPPATSGPASTPSSSSNLGTGTPAGLQSSSPAMAFAGPFEDPSHPANRLRIQSRGRVVGAYPFRPWEMLEGAAPVLGVNDTAVALGFFSARKTTELQ